MMLASRIAAAGARAWAMYWLSSLIRCAVLVVRPLPFVPKPQGIPRLVRDPAFHLRPGSGDLVNQRRGLWRLTF
jgi:hypothetical protein